MYIKEQWIEENTKILKIQRPGVSEKKIKIFLEKQFEKNFRDTEAIIYNNYEEEIIDTTLSSVVDWIQVEKPYISESGCFFKNRYKHRNLNAEIMEGQLDRRGVLKKKMFKSRDEEDYIAELFYNIGQGNEKKRANSGYGAELNVHSFLFNQHSAMSITAAGRSQLSVAGLCFENLFSSSVRFRNHDEFFTYVNNILSEEPMFDIDEVVNIDIDKETFVSHFVGKFSDGVNILSDEIETLYDNISRKKRNKLYYKTNLEKFLMNDMPLKLLKRILKTDCEFLDPNKYPEEIAVDLKLLVELVQDVVGYKYQTFRYEDKMKYDKKDIITVSDTDSTFLYLGLMVKFVNKITSIKLFKNNKERTAYNMKIVNILCAFSASEVQTTLSHYMDKLNIEEEMKHHINMKNEYALSLLITTSVKKSYFGLLYRQEAFIFPKPKLEVKGVNFFKSTSTEKTTDFIYKNILLDRIFLPKSGKIDIRKIDNDIREYESHIKEQILEGEMGYYKKAIKVKSPDAYVNPMSTSYKAVYLWNRLCDETETIETPSVVTLIKINIKNKDRLARLAAEFPDKYEILMDIMSTPELMKETGGKNKKMVFIGANSIAMPYGYDNVPDWLYPIIDVDTIVNDNMKLFAQIYKPLMFRQGSTTFNGEQVKNYTNIIKI